MARNKNAYSTLFEQGEDYGYSYCEGEPDSYEIQSYAGGVKRLSKNFRKNQKIRQKQKRTETKNNASAIKALGKTEKPVNLHPLPEEKAEGMSMGVKLGIGAGVLAVLGFIAYKKFGK